MKTPQRFVLENVNLSAYASSQGFLGWFEAKDRSCEEKTYEIAIGLFLTWIAEINIDFWLVSTLTHWCPDDVLSDEVSLRSIRSFREKGWLVESRSGAVSSGSVDSMANQDIDNTKNDTEDGFRVIDFQEAIVNDLIMLTRLMFRHYVDGHLFFVWPTLQLCVYPHADIGYGVIGVDNEARELGIGLLRMAQEKDVFEVQRAGI